MCAVIVVLQWKFWSLPVVWWKLKVWSTEVCILKIFCVVIFLRLQVVKLCIKLYLCFEDLKHVSLKRPLQLQNKKVKVIKLSSWMEVIIAWQLLANNQSEEVRLVSKVLLEMWKAEVMLTDGSNIIDILYCEHFVHNL